METKPEEDAAAAEVTGAQEPEEAMPVDASGEKEVEAAAEATS